ncbi:hypothetical protein EES41_40735 (plasmid) [Streptomyces sp. ADI95-16]|uniref:hypothetical protein n=1 Tax=unclassified Streptomyces TaxID=2593676 RepID=UPI000F3A9A95|nr:MULTISPECIES: hypothetical protein [unclassified Streptomyces]AYV33105.1 hypothetical protein EES41_40735 [Streptomyces sp. ADI95-16]RPK24658.1 hypothetical protein EES37_37485 [Streptomyces sp. ADI91-18]
MTLVLDPPAVRGRVALDPPAIRGRAAGDPPARPATGARRLVADPEAVDAVCGALSDHYTADVPDAPVILVATDYCVYAADQFAARCADPDRRLRPSDSVALEPSGLLQRFIAATGWRGPGYALGDPAGDGGAALRLATGLVASGRAGTVYVCEVLRRADTGAFTAVATRLRPAGAEPSRAVMDRPAWLDDATWERSAIVREYLRARADRLPARTGRAA